MEEIFELVREVTHEAVQIAADGLWIAVLLALLATIAWRLTIRASASLGCYVWYAAILLTLAMPFALNLTSSIDLWPAVETSANPETQQVNPYNAETQPARGPAALPISQTSQYSQSEPINVSPPLRPIDPTPVESASLQSVLAGLAPMALMWAWLLGSTLLLLRLLFSMRTMYRLKDTSQPLDLTKFPLIGKTVSSARLLDAPVVAISDSLATPVAAGLGNPTVILPRKIVETFTERELDMIVRHEIIHLERRDDWLVLGQRLIQAMLCFNPLIHWMARRLDLAREMACDELVVEHCKSAREYAHCLARLATLPQAPTPLLATGALTGRKHIIRRFDQLLALSRRGGRPMLRVAFATILMLAVTAATVRVAPIIDVPLYKISLTEVKSLLSGPDQAEVEPEQPQAIEFASNPASVPTAVAPHTTEKPAYRSESAAAGIESRKEKSKKKQTSVGYAYSTDSENAVAWASAEADEDDDESGVAQKTTRWAKGVVDAFSNGTSIISDGGGNTTYSWSDGRHKLQVRSRGDVRISDDDQTIESISRRGYLVIFERIGRDERELEVEPDDDGNIQYSYFVDGRRADFDDEAKKWYGEVLLTVIRNTGWNAENRVERIYKKNGTAGVLDEIELINGSYSKRTYYQILMDVAELSAADYERIIRQAEKEIDSDYEKAELLISLSDNIKDNAELIPVFVDVIATIDSDYETRRVLSTISFDHSTDRKVISAVLNIGDRMDSDYEKAELLIDLAEFTENDPELQVEYVEALRGMDSDYETRRVLTELIQAGPLTAKVVDEILDIARVAIDSDYEKAELLIDMADRTETDPKLHDKVMDAVSTIDSDYESRRVIQSWGVDCRKNKKMLMPLLGAADHIDSDYECAELLIDVAECLSDDIAAFQYYLDVAGKVSSGYEKGRILGAVIDDYSGDFSDDQIRALILAANDISTDYEKARVLEVLIPYCQGKGDLEDEIADAIDSISSDYEADNLLAKLYRGSRKRGSR